MNKPTDEWATPPALFNMLNKLLGPITFDVCATTKNSKTENFFRKEDYSTGALSEGVEWPRSIVWMNPPYSNPEPWCRKAWQESQKGTTVIALLPGDSSTGWWHNWVMLSQQVFMLNKRIRFVGARQSYNRPSVVVVWGAGGFGTPAFAALHVSPTESGNGPSKRL